MRVTGEGGVGLEVWVDGPEDGVPVLFLHGWPDSHSLWRHQVAALSAAGFRTIAPDLRGFGASDKPTDVEAYQLKNTVVDAVAILDACGVDKAHVVAHDWGAAAAWGFAAFLPDKVDRLAVLSVGHPTAFFGGGFEQRMRSWYMLLFQFEGIAEKWLLEGDGALFFDGHREGGDARGAMSERGARTGILGGYRPKAHPPPLVGARPPLPPITCPVLGIWSSNDIA